MISSKHDYYHTPHIIAHRFISNLCSRVEGLLPRPSKNPDHLMMDPVSRDSQLTGVVLYIGCFNLVGIKMAKADFISNTIPYLFIILYNLFYIFDAFIMFCLCV